jgi:preprotein translocase subunit SecF
MRTGILTVFGTLFGLALYQDMVSGVFHWSFALGAFLPCLLIGFWIRRWVPMQVYLASQHITLTFDRSYFVLILFLVATKVIAGLISGMTIWADVIMCMILGLMIGRLSGICLRVRDLKIKHSFLTAK